VSNGSALDNAHAIRFSIVFIVRSSCLVFMVLIRPLFPSIRIKGKVKGLNNLNATLPALHNTDGFLDYINTADKIFLPLPRRPDCVENPGSKL